MNKYSAKLPDTDEVEEFLYALLISHSATGKKNYAVEKCAKQISQHIQAKTIERVLAAVEAKKRDYIRVTGSNEERIAHEQYHRGLNAAIKAIKGAGDESY